MMNLPAVPPFAPGTQFLNKYEFRHRIGRGGFGEVWLAIDRALNRPYAIKILDAGVDVDERLLEARATPARAMRRGESPVTSRPSRMMRPPSGHTRPARQSRQAVLPAPAGPRRQSVCLV